MNEIKRQLDEKIGDTDARANRLISKINKEKLQRPHQRKTPSIVPYYVTLGSFAALIVLFFLMNPFNFFQETTSDNPIEAPRGTDDLKSYFQKSGNIAYYEGIGSDIASYSVETTWLFDNYVQHVIENDGAFVQRIYRITEDEVLFVYNQEVVEPASFKRDELDQLPILSIVLKTPLEDGNTFNGKTVSFPETVDTPVGPFDNAVKVSEEMEDGVNHVYYVPNEGIVKTVYAFDDGREVISVLRSVATMNQQTLKSFFRKSGAVAYYVGSSGDTSTYNVETTWLADNYVQHIITYEGTVIQEVYRITDDEIQLVYGNNYESSPAHFDLAALDQLPVLSVLLKTTAQNGETFDGKIASFPEKVDTPIGSFDNAIKISEQLDFGERHIYYVPNEGKVKDVFSPKDSDSDQISELHSVKSASTNSKKYSDLPDSITALNVKTKENKTITLNEHPILQILLNRLGSEKIDSLSFNYIPLSQEDSSAEYGILEFDCTDDICTLVFIKEAQGQSQSILIDYGKAPDSMVISPDGKKAMIGIRVNWDTLMPDSDLYIDRIAFIDLQTLSQIQPAGSEQYYDRPIHEFKWLNDNTIQIVTADIEDYSIEAVEEWFRLKEKAPLKELTVEVQ